MTLRADLLFAQEKADALERLAACKRILQPPARAPSPVAELLERARTLESLGIRNPLHRLLGDMPDAITDTFMDSPNRIPEE